MMAALDGTPAAVPLNRARVPCSPGQRRIWLLDRMDPGNPALNTAVRWKLEGQVSIADLGSAFDRILSRHSSLRTFIAQEDGEPVQRVEPRLPLHIADLDLTGLADAEAWAEADRLAQREARTPFDLSAAPLIRVTHLRVREQVSVVLLTAHRIICDDASASLLGHEMETICAALNQGRTPELPIRRSDALALQTSPVTDHAQGRDEDFWRQSLRGLRHFELQPDRPRPPVQTSNGNRVSLLLGRDVTQGLLDLSSRSGCTLFTTALAALFTLLHRYSEESDIAIGGEVDGRGDPGLERAVGAFTNTLVLRGDLAGDPTFARLLARVHRTVVQSLEHQRLPLNRVIELLKPQRDLSRNALFSVNFIFRQSFVQHESGGGFNLAELPPCCAGTLLDLNFLLLEYPEGWRASCEYNTDLFEPETAGRLLRHFAQLLSTLAADSAMTPVAARKISDLPILDEAERRALAVDCNQTGADYPKRQTVPQLFESQAGRTPDAVALVCGEQSLSYRELDLAANRLAHELRRRGIGRTSRVGICLDRSPDLVVALLAVLKSGGAYVPLDPGYPAARLAQIVEDAQPAAVLTKLALCERLPMGEAPRILLDTEAASISRQPDSPLDSAATADDLAYVIFTSGSTGRPKGVQIQHRALTNLLWSMRREPGLAASDTLVSVTTVSFDIAALELFLPLIVGATLVVAQQEETADGPALLRLLRRHRATVMQATPVTWQILLAAGWREMDRRSRFEPPDPPLKMLCGGEALSRTLADQLLQQGGELWNLYGPTETTIWSSALRVTPGSGPVPIGPPIANTQFYVLDAHGQLAPMGVPGELFIGGDGVAPGYLNLPEMTRERFVPDNFRKLKGAMLYRTGDRVRRRPRGEIEFLGRNDHQIKLRGFRIELGEIEAVLRAHPQVADGVAIAVTDASGENAIRAYVVARRAAAGVIEKDLRSPALAPGAAESTGSAATLINDLHSRLRQALPAYMCPAVIVVLADLPRMPNGKIDRGSLALSAPVQEPAQTPGRPLREREQRLAKIWSAVLGISSVAADANFFEVGGHSLLAVRLLARIETEFGRKLSLSALFKNPTLAGQAALLEQVEQGGDPRDFDFRQVLKLQPHGARPPLIAINNTGIYYVLSKRLGPDQPFTSLQLFDPALPHDSLPRTLEDIAAGYMQLIRRVQPAGPYALLGWCVAGTLAFEVARQLTAAGQKVSQLVLFDTLAPGHLRRLPSGQALLADYSYRWKLIAADWARTNSSQRGLAAWGAFLGNRVIVKKLMRGLGKTQGDETAPLPHDQPLSPEQYDQWLLRYLEQAAESYEPKPYSGTVTLFRSSAEPAGRFLDPKMGWGGFAAGGVDVVVIDGDHFSIFQEPSVSQMAQRIESAVEGRVPQMV